MKSFYIFYVCFICFLYCRQSASKRIILKFGFICQNIYKQLGFMEDKNRYASVYKFVNLPTKRHLNPGTENVFDRTQEKNEYITPAIIKSKTELLSNIEAQLEVFQTTTYNFKFPPSKFPDVPEGTRNLISYEQKVEAVQEDTFKPKLSEEQLKQMKETGTFEVKSGLHNVTIPYVWKVTDWLLRGRVNIVKVWENGLACCYSLFDDATINLVTVIPENLGKLVRLPGKFFSLIFGKKSIQAFYSSNYEREVDKEFWSDIMQNQLKNLNNEIGHQFLELLYLKYESALDEDPISPQGKSKEEYEHQHKIQRQKIDIYNTKKNKIDRFKDKLREVQNKFDSNWAKIRKRVLMKISSQAEQNGEVSMVCSEEEPLKVQQSNITKKDQIILDKLHQQKFLIYTAHLKEHLPKENISMPVIEALIKILTITSIIEAKLRDKHEKLRQIQKVTRESIAKKYTIRSKNHRFEERMVKQIYNPIKERIETQFYEHLFEDVSIRNHLNEPYQKIYAKYLNFRKNFNSLVQQKKATLKCLYEPTRIFRTTYMLLPPFQVKNFNGYYSLDRSKQMRIDTSTHFWKFKLYGMRLKSWTINCLVFLLGFSWVGPFGLRCLFGIEDFSYDQIVNYTTGVKQKVYRTTFLGRFGKVLSGIKKSRQHFEGLPDRGLFGKNFSRLFNYIECYVFRLVFVGIIGVLILYPILIVVLSLLCLMLVVTAWLWVPLIMFITYLFNILIFQFETSVVSSGVIIRGVPLISLVLQIIIALAKCVLSILFLFVVTPIISLLYFLFLLLQRGWRTLTDNIMVCIIGCLGRTPSRDTAIARKISGPGMSRNYFFSIFEEDVYVLTQCALERILMAKFTQLTIQQINKIGQKYEQIMKYTLKSFGYFRPSLSYERDLVLKNKQQLLSYFDRKVSFFNARYPNYPYSIRFTQEEIDSYFENCVKIVKNFVQKQKIEGWIFDERQILYEDYDQLTRSIWIEIFNCGQEIFEPLQKIDTRFKLADENNSNNEIMRRNVSSVMKALQGQVKLNTSRVNIGIAKRSLLDKDYPIRCIHTLCDIHSYNSQIYLDANRQDPCSLFVPHRNIGQLKIYDEMVKKRLQNKKTSTIIEV